MVSVVARAHESIERKNLAQTKLQFSEAVLANKPVPLVFSTSALCVVGAPGTSNKAAVMAKYSIAGNRKTTLKSLGAFWCQSDLLLLLVLF